MMQKRPDFHRIIKYFLVIMLVILSGFLQSCKTLLPVVEKESYSGEYIYENLIKSDKDLETYAVRRVSISIIDNEEEINIRGSVRIQRDSALLLSLSPFAGIEIARILFTVDSVKMIDRINNNFFLGNYEDAQSIIPFAINFNILQSIFFANTPWLLVDLDLLRYSKDEFIFENAQLTFRYSVNNDILVSKDKRDDIIQFSVDKEFFIRSLDYLSPEDNLYLGLKFNSFYNSEGYFLPHDIRIHYVSDNVPLHANIKMGRIEINRRIRFHFNIPSRFNSVQF